MQIAPTDADESVTHTSGHRSVAGVLSALQLAIPTNFCVGLMEWRDAIARKTTTDE
jgi:hypothetical protein